MVCCTGLKRLKDEDRKELRWGIERRLEFIDFQLLWEWRINRINRSDRSPTGLGLPHPKRRPTSRVTRNSR